MKVLSFAGLKDFVLESFSLMQSKDAEIDAEESLLFLMVCKKEYDLLKGEYDLIKHENGLVREEWESLKEDRRLLRIGDLEELNGVELLSAITDQVGLRGPETFFKGFLLSIWHKVKTAMLSNSPEGRELARMWEVFVSFQFGECKEEGGLGGLFEWFLLVLAERSSNGSGYFFTPDGIVKLMIRLLDPKSGERLYDPVCGSGEFLVGAINHVQQSSDVGWLRVLGLEKSPRTAFVAFANALVHDLGADCIEVKDALMSGDYREKVARQFDLAIANPPFSLRNWETGNSANFLYYGSPPQSNADFAFIQNLLFSLNENGRAAIIVPMGVLFRGGSEKEIRRRMLVESNVDAVISIPPMSFYGTAIPANILLMKLVSKTKDVLFIDGASFFSRSQRLNRLESSSINSILSLYSERKSVEGLACCVSLEALAENDWDLTVSKYVALAAKVETESVASLMKVQCKLQLELSMLQEEMKKFLGNVEV
ncbi:N-6 DNA methylase [Pseudomonas sp. 2835]|uniref:N-6 DNA methylase n=1 Tax=Pseudomonas sp. 2835 TaxID=3156451 RepID=UPI003D234348